MPDVGGMWMSWCVSSKTMSRYLDGELPDRAAARVRQHLVECERCARAYESLRALDEALRHNPPQAEAPNLAERVVAELHRRGAFFKARIAADKRRMLGGRFLTVRMAALVSVAASLLVFVAVGFNHLTGGDWARRTEPVLADAERVLVRLVYVDPADEAVRLAWARDEARRLGLAERLAQARDGAGPGWAGHLAPLETMFAALAAGNPLPPEMAAQLSGGELLERAARLHRDLLPGG